MKNGQKIDLGLTGYDELFMTEQERHENRLPKIYDIPLSEIYAFRIACVRFSFASLYVSPYTERYFVFPVVTSFPRGYRASQRPSFRRKILSPCLPIIEPPY